MKLSGVEKITERSAIVPRTIAIDFKTYCVFIFILSNIYNKLCTTIGNKLEISTIKQPFIT